MEEITRNGGDISTEAAGLVALLELRELIASELDQADVAEKGQRSFRPLTDGLGLESPKKKEVAQVTPPTKPLPDLKVDAAKPRLEPTFTPLESREAPRSQSPLAAFMQQAEKEAEKAERAPEVERPQRQLSMTPPPPMPRASVFRRIFSSMMDEIFVLSLVLIAVGVTMKLLAGSSLEFSVAQIKSFQNAEFIRFAILEFATIWLSYFAICVGILDMTFGMWVWGIRITYGNDEGKFLKKLLRVMFSFAFYAPIVPLVLLTIQRKGRNLLDLLSGTTLYRTV